MYLLSPPPLEINEQVSDGFFLTQYEAQKTRERSAMLLGVAEAAFVAEYHFSEGSTLENFVEVF